MTFAPVVLAPEPSPPQGDGKRAATALGEGMIEVDLRAGVVRIGRGADAKAISAVIRALRGGS